ncbi:MBL fold metallo-hydrolase RNA specificity domain-containing protein [Lentzea sp.]|uniref:MBL fold metallo-hydrolase RNA specificity domain-containing protein n=1 Tax=Lentzea sp. TaxID=56099 RepID=UPI002ED17D9B
MRAEVQVLDAFSAHADADELLAWATSGPAPATTYVVHGEPDSAGVLAERLGTEHGWTAVVPEEGERVLV